MGVVQMRVACRFIMTECGELCVMTSLQMQPQMLCAASLGTKVDMVLHTGPMERAWIQFGSMKLFARAAKQACQLVPTAGGAKRTVGTVRMLAFFATV